MTATASQPPLFIVGSERSGSTLLRLLLDHHPDIACHFEFEFVVSQLGSDGSRPDLSSYHAYLRDHRIFNHAEHPIDPDLDYDALVNSFLKNHRTRSNKPLAAATVHYAFDRLPTLWPNAKYVYLLRDGRDVARSVVQLGWAGTIYQAAGWWEKAEKERLHLLSQINPEDMIEVRYEELLAEPRRELNRICQHIGTTFDEAMFSYATPESTYGLPDAKLAYQWKRKFNQAQLREAETRIGQLLIERGYESSGVEPYTITPSRQFMLRLKGWWHRFRTRSKDFGWPLTVAMAVANKLPGKAAKRWATLKRDKVIAERLLR